jgi:tricorn protease
MRLALFAPQIVAAKQRAATRTAQGADFGALESRLPDIFRAQSVTTPHGTFGHLRIRTFSHAPKEFVPEFIRLVAALPQRGLIIDVRGNGGGNVSPMIIERLRRELIMVNITRNSVPRPNPSDMLVGPVTALMDEFSASDGDIFPFRFKSLGMGKLIGKRSWGGVVGIRGTLPLTDGGYLNRPEFGPYAKDGSAWVIEGHGVDPDIVVDNDPAREFKGDDQQLDKAIEVILEELKTKGKDLPPVPAYPKKN